MRILEAWMSAPLAAATGWTLLHSLWEGAVLSAALALVLLALRSPRARYAASIVALLAMLGAFLFTLVRMSPQDPHRMMPFAVLPFPSWNAQSGLDTPPPSNSSLAALVPWLAPFWIAGVGVFYIRHITGWIAVCRLRRRGVCCPPERWLMELTRLSALLRLSRPVRMLESCIVDTPLVLGHLRPLILMPVGLLAGLPVEHVEAILLHELAHIRRHDYLVNLLQHFVEGLLFYHPAVWWLSRVIRAAREHCCDDLVVAVNGNPREYAVALAALEENRWSGRSPAVAATGGTLVKRIRRLLYPASSNGEWKPLLAGVILIAIATAALAAWQSPPPQADRPAANSPYSKWLNEDVLYIIADEERAAFEKLKTDEERTKFIEQFWQRRNPSPGSPVNEFREAYYARIARANQRFRSASGRPGWQTDRGRMYIVYGPPDEIETHPAAAAQSLYPREVWKYRSIEGIGRNLFFTFVDRMRTGDYRLAPGNAR